MGNTQLLPNSYIITADTNLTLENRFGVKLSAGQKKNIKQIETDFISLYVNLLPSSVNAHVISGQSMSNSLEKMISNQRLPVISLDDVYLSPTKYSQLSITRLTNPVNPSEKHVGARPGCLSVEQQLSQLAQKYHSQDVVVADVGAFSGETLHDTLKLMSDYGLNVKRTLLGFSTQNGLNYLHENKVDVVASRVVALDDSKGADWLELRDLMHLDGRKPFTQAIPSSSPPQKKNSYSCIMYSDQPQWASISLDKQNSFRILADRAFSDLGKVVAESGYSLQKKLIRYDTQKSDSNRTLPLYQLSCEPIR